jgi:hypothetical protein
VATYGDLVKAPFAVNGTRVFWGVDKVIKAKVLATGDETTLATAEGFVESLTADEQYVYFTHLEGPCTGWCLRRLSLAPGSVPEPPWYTVSPGATALINDAEAVYWFDEFLGGRIVRLEKTAGPAKAREVATNQGTPTLLVLDGAYIYWASDKGGDGVIKRARIDGSGAPESLVTGLTSPFGIAVDRDNVNWTEPLTDLFRMAPNRVGGQPKTIVSLPEPRALVVAGTSVYIAAQFAGQLQRYSPCDGMVHPTIPVDNPLGLASMGGYVYVSQKGGIARVAP